MEDGLQYPPAGAERACNSARQAPNQEQGPVSYNEGKLGATPLFLLASKCRARFRYLGYVAAADCHGASDS